MRYRSAAGASQPDRDSTSREMPEPRLASVDYELLRRLEVKAHGDFPSPGHRTEAPDRPASAGAEDAEVGPVGAHEPGGLAGRLRLGPPKTRNPAVEVVEVEEAPDIAGVRIPRVVVVDRHGDFARDIARAVRGLEPEPDVLSLDRPTQLIEVAEAEDPDVIVLASDEVTAAALKRLAVIHKMQPKVVILLSENGRTWPAAQLATSGAGDILPAQPTKARLRSRIASALETAAQLRVESVIVTERVVLEKPEPPSPDPAEEKARAATARVFTIASASGGSGKTVVATNLATYLAQATGAKVLLVDLDLQFGEVAPTLHLHPERTIADIAKDPEDLMAAVVEHKCGFKALCAPTDPLAGEHIGPEEVAGILDVARRHFDYVVVDTPPSLNECGLVAFDRSEKLILTANMDVPSLKNLRRFLETLEKLDVPSSQTALVLNRVESGIGLDLKGVGQLFPKGFLTVLQVAKEIPWATNMGVPVLQGNPKAEVSRRLAEGFAKLVPAIDGAVVPWATEQSATRAGLLGLRRGKS
jgi:Flp pilus assembly CpaE family ATPase